MKLAQHVPWFAGFGSAIAFACAVDHRSLDRVGVEEGGTSAGASGGADGQSSAGRQGGAPAEAGAGGTHSEEGATDLSGIALTEAVDLDPDPHVVKVELDAAPVTLPLNGKSTQFWAFNGTVPGPLIRVRRGDHLTVHFVNHLEEGTMIHWHGVRVPNAMDGTPMVQAPVMPGQSFDYDFDLPDPGLYWYHPHLDIPTQVMRGLYGAILVEEPSEQTVLPARDVVVVLSDAHVDETGALNFEDDAPMSLLNGREGTSLLVNGRVAPKIDVTAGEALRLRFVNAAGARYFQLRVPGQTWHKVGADGGLANGPRGAGDILVTNGERAELVLVPRGKVGDELTLQQVPYYRGAPLTSDEPVTLLTLRIADQAPRPAQNLPSSLRAIEPLSIQGATPVDLDITLQGTTFLVNGVPGGEAPHLMGHVGETQHWRVKNETALDHPFHVHGYFFQVVSPETGQPRAPLEWRDTVNIARNQSLELLIKYDRPGMWMWHCHILDHAELGFMEMLHVTP